MFDFDILFFSNRKLQSALIRHTSTDKKYSSKQKKIRYPTCLPDRQASKNQAFPIVPVLLKYPSSWLAKDYQMFDQFLLSTVC